MNGVPTMFSMLTSVAMCIGAPVVVIRASKFAPDGVMSSPCWAPSVTEIDEKSAVSVPVPPLKVSSPPERETPIV